MAQELAEIDVNYGPQAQDEPASTEGNIPHCIELKGARSLLAIVKCSRQPPARMCHTPLNTAPRIGRFQVKPRQLQNARTRPHSGSGA
jgi:hypothetical protein